MATATLDMRTLADNLSDMPPEDQAPLPLGSELEHLRAEVYGLTQVQFAKRFATTSNPKPISETTISNWERGRTTPKRVEAARLRKVLAELAAEHEASKPDTTDSPPLPIAESELVQVRVLFDELVRYRAARVFLDEASDAEVLAEIAKRIEDARRQRAPRGGMRVGSAPDHLADPAIPDPEATTRRNEPR